MGTEELIKRLRDEIGALREQNAGLRQLVAELGERNAQLRQGLTASEKRIAELEQSQKGPPSFVKSNKPKREGPKAARRLRAKEHNHGRRRPRGVRNTIWSGVRCVPVSCAKSAWHGVAR